jgi:hypothetical protein
MCGLFVLEDDLVVEGVGLDLGTSELVAEVVDFAVVDTFFSVVLFDVVLGAGEAFAVGLLEVVGIFGLDTAVDVTEEDGVLVEVLELTVVFGVSIEGLLIFGFGVISSPRNFCMLPTNWVTKKSFILSTLHWKNCE